MGTRNILLTAAAVAILTLGVRSPAAACVSRPITPEMSAGPHDYSNPSTTSKLWREGDPGEPLRLRLRVLDTCGESLAGTRVQVLHANQDGDHDPDRWRAVMTSDERGELELLTVYPGYAGGLPRHIHFVVSHPRHRELVTRLFFKSDPAAADESIEAVTVVLDEVRADKVSGWVGGYEFVLAPK
jgi:protocatechuate 3,4-dioxygenase beta subunit